MRKIIFVFIFLIFTGNFYKNFAYDTTAAKYYPLAVGNSWTYSYSGFPCCGFYRYKEVVTGTISTNAHFYYIITTYRIGFSQGIEYRRIDSVKNNILIYSTSGCSWLQNEITGDSIGAHLGDSSKYICVDYYRLTDTSNINVFGMTKKGKNFNWSNYFEGGATRRFVKDIGFYSSFSYYHTSNTSISLLGCTINGVLYGDTSLTGIKKISSEIPDKFSLSQNYPNPFNPSTKIRFEVPLLSQEGVSRRDGVVALKIYDALGKEVATLVNEQLKPGEYETEFDGTNLPSGVYYYQLVVGDNPTVKSGTGNNNGGFTETKKMVLIK